jgi:hypothetical protein
MVGGSPEPIDPGFSATPPPPESEWIVHFDGTQCQDVPAPSSISLFSVWGAAANDVWAGGGDGSASGTAVMLHYDGTAWKLVKQDTGAVQAIWGTSSSDVWFAGGSTGGSTIWHWDGDTLRSVSTPAGAFGLLTLWGFSTSDVWAGGEGGTLLHWDGTSWSSVSSGTDLYIYGLWGASPDDLWAVGNGGNLLHWNGATISGTSTGYVSFAMIYGVSRNDIWAIGDCCWNTTPSGWGGHYDGTQWTRGDLPIASTGSGGLWAAPDGTYYALSNGQALWSFR